MLEIFDLFLDLLLLDLVLLVLLGLDMVVFGVFVVNFTWFLVVILLGFGGESWRVEVFGLIEGVIEDFDWRGLIEVRIVIFKNEEKNFF